MITAALLVLLGTLSSPGSILLPETLIEPEGVCLEAQLPEPGLKLIPKDPERPKLWYAPVASLPTEDGVRLWYQRVNAEEEQWVDQRVLCTGEIRDGRWVMPALRPDPTAWGGINNVCLTRSPHKPTWGGFNVFQLTESGGMLHLLYWDQPDAEGRAGAMLATSTDGGLTWVKRPGTVFTEHNDAYTLLKRGDEFWLYQTMLEDWPDKPFADNLDGKRRVQCFRSSSDLEKWTDQEVILRPDDRDPPETEFYLMKTFPHGGGYAGLLMKYYADPALEGKHSGIIVNELMVSRDGKHWERPFRDTDIGFWSYADPFDLGGKTHFAIWKDGAMETVCYQTGRLTGVTAEDEGHFALTVDPNTRLPRQINADTRQGWLEIQVIDGHGNVQEDHGQCRVENVDDTAIPLNWNSDTPAPGLRLQVRMKSSTFFGF